jgi:hypothetical protein
MAYLLRSSSAAWRTELLPGAVDHDKTGANVRPGRREAAGGHSGFEAVWNVHNGVTIC